MRGKIKQKYRSIFLILTLIVLAGQFSFHFFISDHNEINELYFYNAIPLIALCAIRKISFTHTLIILTWTFASFLSSATYFNVINPPAIIAQSLYITFYTLLTSSLINSFQPIKPELHSDEEIYSPIKNMGKKFISLNNHLILVLAFPLLSLLGITQLSSLFHNLHMSTFIGTSANNAEFITVQYSLACDIYLTLIAFLLIRRQQKLSIFVNLIAVLLLVTADIHSYIDSTTDQYLTTWSNHLWLIALCLLAFSQTWKSHIHRVSPQRFLQFNLYALVAGIVELLFLAFEKQINFRNTIPLLIVISLTCISFLNVISNHVLALKLGENSLRDPLTQLPNRKAFFQQLHSLWGQEFVLALMDLNKFKEINDCFGHFTGDQILILVSQRLQKYLPVDAILARLGGDEFALIAPLNAHDSIELLHLVANIFSYPFIVSERQYEIGISIGFSHFTSESFTNELLTPGMAMERVDYAMYEAKNSGITISNGIDETQRY